MNKSQIAIKEAAKRYRFDWPLIVPIETSNGRPVGKPYIPKINRRGYPVISVRMRKLDISIRIQVHQIVAYQKYGDNMFSPGILCRHLNNDKKDFSSDNIAIGTPKDNYEDNPESYKTMFRTFRGNRKLTKEQVIEIRTAAANGKSFGGLMKEYNVSRNTVRYIVRRLTYADIV